MKTDQIATDLHRMMKMSGRVTVCCVALLLTLSSVSAIKKLNSINDLKKVNFGQSVPKHSILLLHWFASVIEINNNNIIRLTFDPNNGDYGSHHYGNFERMLEAPPQGHQYFTVGNLNSDELPNYVLNPQPEYEGNNRDRIVFRVRHNLQCIDQVYITQHYPTSEQQGTRYDPEHTYQVSNNLLRAIRQFSMGQNQQSLSQLRDRFESGADDFQLRHIRNTWGALASLGLLLFIVIQEKHSSNKQNTTKRPQRSVIRNARPDFVVNIPENQQNHIDEIRFLQAEEQTIQLAVTTGRDGKARIVWSNIPRHRLKTGVMVVLFKNNEDQEASRIYKCIDTKSGSYDTSEPLNDGLQARLHKVRIQWCFLKRVGEEICRGTEFKSPTDKVNIAGYNARLQLFVKDGNACARLFVLKTFTEWRSEFKKSWVGFYTSARKPTNQYEWWQWQWATKFRRNTDVRNSSYDVYEFHTNMAMAPGVQARFILQGNDVRACTASWR